VSQTHEHLLVVAAQRIIFLLVERIKEEEIPFHRWGKDKKENDVIYSSGIRWSYKNKHKKKSIDHNDTDRKVNI